MARTAEPPHPGAGDDVRQEDRAWPPRTAVGLADVDGEALARDDESIAERFDKERARRN
jgi:hypothetical protein